LAAALSGAGPEGAGDGRLLLVAVRPPPRSALFPYTTLFRSRPRGPRRHSPHRAGAPGVQPRSGEAGRPDGGSTVRGWTPGAPARSEEHTSELQSRFDLVCRLLLEKKKRTAATFHVVTLAVSA